MGASATAYGLRLWPGSAPSPAPLATALATDQPASPESIQRLLGAAPQAQAALPTDTRYSLLGVAAARADDQQRLQGVALLSVDGGPPRAVRVGQWVDGQSQLIAVSSRGAELGRDGVARVHLPLQGAPEAATGSLPPPASLAPSPTPAAGAQVSVVPQLPATPLQGVAMPPMPAMPGPSAADSARDADESGPKRPLRQDSSTR